MFDQRVKSRRSMKKHDTSGRWRWNCKKRAKRVCNPSPPVNHSPVIPVKTVPKALFTFPHMSVCACMCVYKGSWGHVVLSFKGVCVCWGGVHTQGQSLFLGGETLKSGQFSLWGGLSPVLNSVNHAWREHARSVVDRASPLMASPSLRAGWGGGGLGSRGGGSSA